MQSRTWKHEYAAWKERQERHEPEFGRKRGRSADPADPEPICPRRISNDPTIEAAAQLLQNADEHGKLALVQDELAAFYGSFARYSKNSGSARALWLEAYDGGPQRIDRILRGHIFVPNWSVIIAGNIQTRRLQEFGADLTTDGLFQRMMAIHARPTELGVEDDRPLDSSIGASYRELHAALAALRPARDAGGELTAAYVDDDGLAERRRLKRLWERLQADPTLPAVIRETAPKWSGLLARLSLIFHVVELAEQCSGIVGARIEPRRLHCVSGATVTKAATFVRRILLPNLHRLGFETMPGSGAPVANARWIAGHILAHGLTSITTRTIGRAHRELRGKPGVAAEAMNILADAGWAAKTAGRHDSLAWLVNPAVHVCFAEAAANERARRERARNVLKENVNEL